VFTFLSWSSTNGFKSGFPNSLTGGEGLFAFLVDYGNPSKILVLLNVALCVSGTYGIGEDPFEIIYGDPFSDFIFLLPFKGFAILEISGKAPWFGLVLFLSLI
jgi:hypothetical protein